MPSPPRSVSDTLALLGRGNYVADRSLATAVYLSLSLGRPLFLEGEAGVGKTEIGKVLAETLGRRLIRLQCYEGLDVASAVYEWNYARQMIEIRLAESGHESRDTVEEEIFSDRFLIKRPLLQALEPDLAGPPVLLIDELDRTDEPFEAYLLEVLSDFQITIPEIGTIKAKEPPIVVITSNRTREIHDALKRRCFYYWIDYPERRARARDPPDQGAGRRGRAEPRGRRLRPEAPRHLRSLQAAGRRRDHRLGACPDPARRAGADARGDQRHARRAAQIPGRHREDPGQRGRTPALPGQGRARRGAVMEGIGASPRPGSESDGRLLANIMYFARALRAAGLPIGPGKVLAAVEAVRAVGIESRDDFYWTLHAVFVNRRDQRELFDQAFHIFWRNPKLLERMIGLLLPTIARAGESARRRDEPAPRRGAATGPAKARSRRKPRSSSTPP